MVDSTLQVPDAIRNANNLPSLPSVAMEVLRISKDPDAGIDDLAHVIALDPALSTKIVKLANSPHYRRGRDITNVPQAAVVLGMKSVTLLALSFSLTNCLPRRGDFKSFDYLYYWKRSLATAVAARALARLVRLSHGDEAFLCGLLARIGQLVMATTIGGEYCSALATTKSRLPSRQTERATLGYDFHQVGGALLLSWDLPELLAGTVARWEDDLDTLQDVDEDTLEVCRLLQVGDAIADLICDPDKGQALMQIHDLATDHFGLADEETDNFIVTLQEEMNVTASALDIDVSGCIDYDRMLGDARQQLIQITLESVADLEHAQARAQELEQQNQELDIASKTDQLTRLPNRACFDTRLNDVIEARLNGFSESALGILVIDIDHFKSFNDTHGHILGDRVLRTVARWLVGATRDTDFIARYGGEEFVAILPNTTLADLESVAERLRARVEGGGIKHEQVRLSVTISIGGACVDQIIASDDGKVLLDMADKCLYLAKNAGRNRVVCRGVTGSGLAESVELKALASDPL